MAASDPFDDPPPLGHAAGADQPDTGDLKSFARDWITIWHSELAAAALDREAAEAWQAAALHWVRAWAGAAEAAVAAMPADRTRRHPPGNPAASAAHDRRAAPSGPAAPPGAAAADAAPDARDAEVARLAERIAELERRLAERDPPGGPNAKGKPPPRPRRSPDRASGRSIDRPVDRSGD